MADQRAARYAGTMTQHLTTLDEAVDLILSRTPGPLRMGAPLGIGKPHRLLNALYARIARDPARPLEGAGPSADPGRLARIRAAGW